MPKNMCRMVIDNNDIPKQDYMVLCSTITYNQAPYIIDTMNGLCMQQTNFPFVCYIIDDASTDGEQDVIKAYLNEHFQMDKAECYELELVNVIVAKHNTNPNCTFAVYLLKRNLWKEPDLKRPLGRPWAQRCKYIACCEGDDYWTDPLKLQKQVDFMEAHPEVGLCYTDYQVLNDTNQSLSSAVFANGFHRSANFADHLLTSGYIAPMTWIMRNDIYTQLSAPFQRCTDGTFALALDFYANSQVAYLPDVTAVYRVHLDSASNQTNPKKKWKYLYGVFQIQLQYAEKYDKSLLPKVKLRRYLDLLPLAVQCDENAFVCEATAYLEDEGVDVNRYINLIKNKMLCEKCLENIKKSYAYRIGKIITHPFSI